MEKTVTLEGNQIRLRDWRKADLSLFAQWMEPGHRWQEFDGPYYPHPDAEEMEDILDRLGERIKTGSWETPRLRLVIADRQNNQLLGIVTWYWQSIETNWLSVGISIYDPVFWNRGLGAEALGLWGDYLLASLPDVVRLDLRTWSGNHGMMRLAEKLGYRLEARFRQARIVNGRYYDGIGYGILREEWQARYPRGFAAFLRDRK